MKRITALMVAAATLAAATFTAAAAAAQDIRREPPRDRAAIQLSFAPVVSDAAPAVVNVYAQRMVRRRATIFDDPMFRRFFGDDFGGMPRDRVTQSLGSGVVVADTGIIVTNNHVVDGAQELRVVLSDRREFDAEVMLADERTDLAVLQIDTGGERLPTLRLKDSASLAVGDLVLAIGNPFGVGQTVTSGIVSALGRSDVGVSDYSFFIQTDAAINPGNSGGALVDVDGALVGINTAIFSRSGGSNGIGFAIPSELVSRVVENAISGGRIERAWFGARGQTVTPDIARSIDLDRPRGVIVSDLYDDGPAERAGVRAGDVITEVDGVEVNDFQAIRFRLATRRIGERAELRVWRNGRERTVRLQAEAPPETPPRDPRTLVGGHPLAGAEVVNLSPAVNETLGVDLFARGVSVSAVSANSAAAYYGFRPGDIIEAVNGEPVSGSADLEDVIAIFDGSRNWVVQVIRDGRRFTRRFRS